jgi:hypothetical protein
MVTPGRHTGLGCLGLYARRTHFRKAQKTTNFFQGIDQPIAPSSEF